jgi:hypothetical protein
MQASRARTPSHGSSTEAFNARVPLFGGFVGVLVTGFKRAAFSNEAGVGSAAIAHSAAKTDVPGRARASSSLLEPFIDTVIVCTMTALVIVTTDADESTRSTPAVRRGPANRRWRRSHLPGLRERHGELVPDGSLGRGDALRLSPP